MNFPLTREMLHHMLNGNPDSDMWYDALSEIMPKYKINTPKRIAGFISQCAHESYDFRRIQENLNYSESALNTVFSRYFGTGRGKRNAKDYARQPEKIANYVYMDKYRTKKGALGNIYDGDGWRFRGRGLKQLTGRNNYEAFGKTVGMTAEQAAEYVATPKGAVESACWFWDRAKLNRIADKGDIVAMTKKINGGTIGLEDRVSRWKKALSLFGLHEKSVDVQTKTKTRAPNITRTLSIGSRGDDVKALQKMLGVPVDGYYGSNTKRAVKLFQMRNRLVPDGVAGPNTLEVLSRK